MQAYFFLVNQRDDGAPVSYTIIDNDQIYTWPVRILSYIGINGDGLLAISESYCGPIGALLCLVSAPTAELNDKNPSRR